MNFANKIKAERKRLGLSQKKLCEILQIPRRTLEDWEVEVNIPPIYIQTLLLDYFFKHYEEETL